MLPTRAFRVYDVLVKHAGAAERDRDAFVIALMGGCEEYRFGGLLGFGGKYRPGRNAVDCYPEDETPARKAVIAVTNAALSLVDPAPAAG